MPFGIKPPSSSKTRPAAAPAPAPAPSETKTETPKRRVGRPRKSEQGRQTPDKVTAESNAVVPDSGRSVTRSLAKTAVSSTSVNAPQAPQKKSVKRRADHAVQAQPSKRVGRPANMVSPESQPADLPDVARGQRALAQSREQEQSQTSAHSASSSTSTATSLSDVQSGFELLVSQYPAPMWSNVALVQAPALSTLRGPWMPGQRVDHATLGDAVTHLESLGYTEQSLKRVFTAQREPAVGYAVLGALVRYTPDLIAVGLTPPDIARLAAPSPAPLGRLVMGRSAWQAAGLTVPFLVPVAMHAGATPESFGALLRHLSPFVAAGGEVRALLQAYYRNEGLAVFENMLREQQRATSTLSSRPQQATASTNSGRPAQSRPQTSTQSIQSTSAARPLTTKQTDEADDDAQMLRQLTSVDGVGEPAQKRRLTEAQEARRHAIRNMSDEARNDLHAFSSVLQKMGMSLEVVVQITTQSPLEAPLALVRDYASVVVELGVSIQDVGKLALRDLSLETLRQFSVQAPTLMSRGMTPAQLMAFATTAYHAV